jgi:hypothetical protein
MGRTLTTLSRGVLVEDSHVRICVGNLLLVGQRQHTALAGRQSRPAHEIIVTFFPPRGLIDSHGAAGENRVPSFPRHGEKI